MGAIYLTCFLVCHCNGANIFEEKEPQTTTLSRNPIDQSSCSQKKHIIQTHQGPSHLSGPPKLLELACEHQGQPIRPHIHQPFGRTLPLVKLWEIQETNPPLHPSIPPHKSSGTLWHCRFWLSPGLAFPVSRDLPSFYRELSGPPSLTQAKRSSRDQAQLSFPLRVSFKSSQQKAQLKTLIPEGKCTNP